jgi:hypothetical protein
VEEDEYHGKIDEAIRLIFLCTLIDLSLDQVTVVKVQGRGDICKIGAKSLKKIKKWLNSI